MSTKMAMEASCERCGVALADEGRVICPCCGHEVASGFDAPLRALRDVVDGIQRGSVSMTAERVEWLTAHVIGAAQQALDLGREQLAKSLDEVRETIGAGECLSFIERFDGLQRRMNVSVGEVGDVLALVRTPYDLQTLRPRLDHATAGMQQACADLRALAATAADPHLAAPLSGEVSQDAAQALQSMEGAANALAEWIGEADPEQLQEALRQLDAARERVMRLLDETTVA